MQGPIIFFSAFVLAIIILLVILKISQLLKYGYITRKSIFSFIEKSLLIISSITILITLLWDFNYIRYKPPIPHCKWKSITLNDFRGIKRPNMILDGQSKFAFVSTSIRTKKNKDKIVIETLFHPCRSYVYNKNLYSNGLLTHEMYHFHITEYCARQMRKEIKNRINNGEKINLHNIKNKILLQENELQYQYDYETYHSYIYGKQLEWQNKIDSFLVSLEDFSNTILTLAPKNKN